MIKIEITRYTKQKGNRKLSTPEYTLGIVFNDCCLPYYVPIIREKVLLFIDAIKRLEIKPIIKVKKYKVSTTYSISGLLQIPF